MYLVQLFEILCLILNLIWLTCFWIYSTKDVLKVKFLNSSVNPLMSKYKYKSFIFNNIKSEREHYYIPSPEHNNVSNFSKEYEMKFNIFIKNDTLYIFKISKIKKKRDKQIGSISYTFILEISLFRTQLDGYRIQYSDNPLISKCWTSKIKGKILNIKFSNDNLNLLIYYSIRKGPYKEFRIRYFHDLIGCESFLLDNEIPYLDEKGRKKNIFNNVYDDFAIEGSYKINAFAIGKNVIVYSRSKDFHSFYLLERVESDGKILWELQNKGIKNGFEFFHSNNIIFLSNHKDFKYSIINSFVEVNDDKNVYVNTDIYHMNRSMSIEENSVEKTLIYNVKLEKRLEIPLGRLELSSKKTYNEYFGKLLHTVSSSSSNMSNIFMELNQNILYSLNYNPEENRYDFLEILKGNIETKISNIYIEKGGNNAVLQYEDSNDLHLISKEFYPSDKIFYTISLISKDSFPRDFRHLKILSFSFETIEQQMILFVLFENGVVLSFDLTNVKYRWTMKNLFYCYLRELDFREWAKLNILFNTLNFLQISILSLVGICSSRRMIRTHLTRIIQDAANMNDHLQRNVYHLMMNHNQLSRTNQNTLSSSQLIAFANTNTILQIHIQTLLSQANSLSRSLSNSGTIITHVTKILSILQLQIRYIDLFFHNSRLNTSYFLRGSQQNEYRNNSLHQSEDHNNEISNNEINLSNEEINNNVINQEIPNNNILNNDIIDNNQNLEASDLLNENDNQQHDEI